MTDAGQASRAAALDALAAVEDGAYSNLVVPTAVAELTTARDRAFASHLAYDTLRWQGTLDWALGEVLTRRLGDVEPALRRLLRLGALQLLFTDVPPRAVVATAAELAATAVPGRRARGATGFVNGVLRALARRRDHLPWPQSDADPVAHLALRTGHPAWVVAELLPRFGLAATRALLDADNDPPGVTLRAHGDRDALVAELQLAGVAAAPGGLAPEAVRAPGADPRRLAAVADGRAVPQDEASMVVSRATRVVSRAKVADLCAGPGGKATHLAALAGPGGRVTALEVHPGRARQVEAAARRLGVRVDTVVGDAAAPPFAATFDVVLLDAPCTGLGTGRRRPEVRWRRSPEDVASLAALQRRLVTAALPLVRPGGHLTYAVCTWTEAETTGVTGPLVAAHPEFERVEQRQLRPDLDATDGMYLAVFRRRPW